MTNVKIHDPLTNTHDAAVDNCQVSMNLAAPDLCGKISKPKHKVSESEYTRSRSSPYSLNCH